jgi:hypothetical protein
MENKRKKRGMERGEGPTIYVDLWRFRRRGKKVDEGRRRKKRRMTVTVKLTASNVFVLDDDAALVGGAVI